MVVSLMPLDKELDKPPVLAPAHATIRQKGKTFLPHILAITAGTVVDFPNDDPIFHNAFSNYNGQIFDLTLYPPGTTRSVHFTRPGVVRVFCNIHASMSAVIVVLKTPYFAVSNRDGTFAMRSSRRQLRAERLPRTGHRSFFARTRSAHYGRGLRSGTARDFRFRRPVICRRRTATSTANPILRRRMKTRCIRGSETDDSGPASRSCPSSCCQRPSR